MTKTIFFSSFDWRWQKNTWLHLFVNVHACLGRGCKLNSEGGPQQYMYFYLYVLDGNDLNETISINYSDLNKTKYSIQYSFPCNLMRVFFYIQMTDKNGFCEMFIWNMYQRLKLLNQLNYFSTQYTKVVHPMFQKGPSEFFKWDRGAIFHSVKRGLKIPFYEPRSCFKPDLPPPHHIQNWKSL